jgi:hypothetical protein
MVGFGLYLHADKSNLVVIWRHVENGRKSVSDTQGGMCAWKQAAVVWKLYRVGFKKKYHRKPSQYAWFIVGRLTAFFSTRLSRHCHVKTVGPMEDVHLIIMLVMIRYWMLLRRLSMMILVNSDLKCDVSEIVSVSIIRQ